MELKLVSQWFEEGRIPLRLKGHMLENCETCGYPIVMNEEMTYRRCLDHYCRGHVAQKADRMFKYLKVPGIGVATATRGLAVNKLKSHLDLIPIYLDYKPSVHLFEIAIMAQIDGERESLEEELKGYTSFEDYFKSGHVTEGLYGFKNDLIRAQNYFKIKPPLPDYKIEVMITGSLDGYSKDTFVNMCNTLLEGKMYISQVGLKNSAYACITEDKTSSNRKAQLARGELRPGIKIPMYTSKEFLQIVALLALPQEELEEKLRLMEQ